MLGPYPGEPLPQFSAPQKNAMPLVSSLHVPFMSVLTETDSPRTVLAWAYPL